MPRESPVSRPKTSANRPSTEAPRASAWECDRCAPKTRSVARRCCDTPTAAASCPTPRWTGPPIMPSSRIFASFCSTSRMFSIDRYMSRSVCGSRPATLIGPWWREGLAKLPKLKGSGSTLCTGHLHSPRVLGTTEDYCFCPVLSPLRRAFDVLVRKIHCVADTTGRSRQLPAFPGHS